MDVKIPDIIFVFGKICSGKNYFSEACAMHRHVIVSDIVRSIIKSSDREKLSDTKHLDSAIADQLLVEIAKGENVVIDGIRQLTVLTKVLNEMNPNLTYEYVWLEVPEDELERRFIERGAEKDKNITFQEALKRDNDLGLGELEEVVKAYFKTQIIHN